MSSSGAARCCITWPLVCTTWPSLTPRVHTTSSPSPASVTLRCTAFGPLHDHHTHRPHAPPSRSSLRLAAAAVRARRAESIRSARHCQQTAHPVCQPALVRHWPQAASRHEQLHGQRGHTPPSAHAGGPGGEDGAGGGKARGGGGRIWECAGAAADCAQRAAASRGECGDGAARSGRVRR